MLSLSLVVQIQTSLVPQTILKDWAEKTFVTNTDYWTFRKQVCTCEDCAWYTGGPSEWPLPLVHEWPLLLVHG